VTAYSASKWQLWRDHRVLVIAAALALGALLTFWTEGEIEVTDGFFYDAALALLPGSRETTSSPVVVIAIDQQSLASPQFAAIPRVFLSPHLAELLEGLAEAGAKAVGIDVVLSFAASRSAHVDPSFDQPLIAALAKRRDQTILARTVRTPVAAPFVAALFDPSRDAGREEPAAIAYAELSPSADGVQRRVLQELKTVDGVTLPTLAAALARLAGASPPSTPLMLAPRAPIETLPTYSFAQVLSCLKDDPEQAAQLFRGKIALIGSTLPEEDRKRAPDRFMRLTSQTAVTPLDRGPCGLPRLGPSDPESGTIPGVHVHAATVEGLISGRLAVPFDYRVRLASAVGLAAVGAGIALLFPPLWAVFALLIGLLLTFIGSMLLLDVHLWVPPSVPMLSMFVAVIEGQVIRFYVVERRRRRVERAFGHYLAPTIVDALAEEEEGLELGGQVRQATIMFADLTGFTAASEVLQPSSLMALTNRYFEVIVAAIEAHAGYVDKFVGDSVMAIWGAPAKSDDHAQKATAAALEIIRKVAQLRRSGQAAAAADFAVKIGIGTGRVIVGNVGARHRLNYSALGEAVNVAARLEKACAEYGCPIVVDDTTAKLAQKSYLMCEIDSTVLRGKSLPMSIFDVVAEHSTATLAQQQYVSLYGEALRNFRAGAFGDAARIWSSLSTHPGCGTNRLVPAVMGSRAAVNGGLPAANS
jgi:class 3 adenylate cyclase/CHASE2 domain-containing sensor protein